MITPEYSNRPENLIGRHACDVLQEIARLNPQVNSMTFARYYPLDKEEVDLFWYPSREEILRGGEISQLASDEYQDVNSLVGAVSLVDVGGGMEKLEDGSGIFHFSQQMHIPMMDFLTLGRNQKEDLAAVKWFLQNRLKERVGWILSSGNGYHYYGSRLLDKTGWAIFMKEAVFEGPRYALIDRAFIDKALLPKIARQTGAPTQYVTLRIGRNSLKPQIPIVVDILKTV